MSIKTLSETGFMETGERILRSIAVIKKDTVITEKTSFREELNMTSLDIAEMLIDLEAEYNVKLDDFVNLNNIYNLSDVYKNILEGISRQRKNFIAKQNLQNNKGTTQMTEKVFSYDEIFKASQEVLVKDPELTLTQKDITPTARLLFDLGLDALTILQLIMGLEKKFNIKINDKEIMKRKLHNFGELCRVICDTINNKGQNKMYYTENDIFEIVRNHIEEHFGKYLVAPESKFYTDLSFSNFEATNLLVWIEEKFAIKLGFVYPTTVRDLCAKIFKKLPEKYKEPQPNLLQRIKQKFIQRQK